MSISLLWVQDFIARFPEFLTSQTMYNEFERIKQNDSGRLGRLVNLLPKATDEISADSYRRAYRDIIVEANQLEEFSLELLLHVVTQSRLLADDLTDLSEETKALLTITKRDERGEPILDDAQQEQVLRYDDIVLAFTRKILIDERSLLIEDFITSCKTRNDLVAYFTEGFIKAYETRARKTIASAIISNALVAFSQDCMQTIGINADVNAGRDAVVTNDLPPDEQDRLPGNVEFMDGINPEICNVTCNALELERAKVTLKINIPMTRITDKLTLDYLQSSAERYLKIRPLILVFTLSAIRKLEKFETDGSPIKMVLDTMRIQVQKLAELSRPSVNSKEVLAKALELKQVTNALKEIISTQLVQSTVSRMRALGDYLLNILKQICTLGMGKQYKSDTTQEIETQNAVIGGMGFFKAEITAGLNDEARIEENASSANPSQQM